MIVIRKAGEEDVELIQTLATATWPAAYEEVISAEQIRYMLDKMYSSDELAMQLREGHTFLVAEEDSLGIGFAGFSLVDPQRQVYKLHKLYVLPQAHGKGIGNLLVGEVVKLASQAGGKSLQLNVNRKNKSVSFYSRAGFEIKETVDLDIGKGFYMNDYLMEKSI